ncbi:MAG: dihydropteroate synthase [Helicobacteraceae bacterium]
MLSLSHNPLEVLRAIKPSGAGFEILKDKISEFNFHIKDLDVRAANILKQDALSLGCDLALPKGAIAHEQPRVDGLLMCNKKQLKALVQKERRQPWGLADLALDLSAYERLKTFPLEIMGVINLNDDSFFSASRARPQDAVQRALRLIDEGADILDFGGVSSRPGSRQLSAQDELERIKPAIDLLYKEKIYEKCTLSIDSFLPLPIQYALDRGFKIVNDITGLANDEICRIAARAGARVCIMHMQGAPENMQQNPFYKDAVWEIKEFFKERVQKAASFGIKELILDVGIGFGKTLEHNLELINHQKDFLTLGYPLLVGASRKSLIDAISKSAVSDRLPGTLILHAKAFENGASIIRCHDAKEHKQALSVLRALRGSFK